MDSYYVNNTAQAISGHHEVHKWGCPWLKKAHDTSFLGQFYSCTSAVMEAKKTYPYTADGCYHCSCPCHRG